MASELILKCFVEIKYKLIIDTLFCLEWMIILSVNSINMLELTISIICILITKLYVYCKEDQDVKNYIGLL